MIAPELLELFFDPKLEDLVLKPEGIFFYREGRWNSSGAKALGEFPLEPFARHLAEKAGVCLGLTQPTSDGTWTFEHSGQVVVFRSHVAWSPLVLQGPEITLRRLASNQNHGLASFCKNSETSDQIRRHISNGSSILIVGATGSGKTSLAQSILDVIPQHERVLILEDTSELKAPNPISTKLLTRTDRFGFRSGAHWSLEELVFEALRMRPDRIVLGECRGREASAIFTAAQTGHRGLLTTLHAGSASEGLQRFARLAGDPAGAAVWDLVIHIEVNAETRSIKELKEIRNE